MYSIHVISLEFTFWLLGNVCIKPYFNTQCSEGEGGGEDYAYHIEMSQPTFTPSTGPGIYTFLFQFSRKLKVWAFEIWVSYYVPLGDGLEEKSCSISCLILGLLKSRILEKINQLLLRKSDFKLFHYKARVQLVRKITSIATRNKC